MNLHGVELLHTTSSHLSSGVFAGDNYSLETVNQLSDGRRIRCLVLVNTRDTAQSIYQASLWTAGGWVEAVSIAGGDSSVTVARRSSQRAKSAYAVAERLLDVAEQITREGSR